MGTVEITSHGKQSREILIFQNFTQTFFGNLLAPDGIHSENPFEKRFTQHRSKNDSSQSQLLKLTSPENYFLLKEYAERNE